ncbi:winged helix-turn-helix transcriptional regulator [Vagococcus intermedius]|uniref:Helix-turn-helix transcriptional regulator n=1 Tax=Vagococcus intermedius TaxID=2991418 RepID=A0AAF0CTJ9_9ENTE|nr:helix-turn-helix domain-containing protein [Vagococcus intermedius]WEG72683.1 helix-turn-helix transcriptional regulator [Vagococcus intermedius]WEG74768.1 helix-turn-helix transcriptional regulator [Vagococcus intermedius]
MEESECQKRQFQLCPKFEKTFSILGKRWNGLIIDVLLEEGCQRFGELAAKIPNLSDRVLVERLKELESNGIIERLEDEENSKKVEYRLTEMGQDLRSTMQEIQRWSEKWLIL